MKKTEFKDIKELDKILTPEQKRKAKKDFKKYYLDPFGKSEPVMCTPEIESNGEEYLVEVNLEDFD